MNHDVVPAVLAIRHISRIFDRNDGTVFGAYPGVELLALDSDAVIAELDVVVILANGLWLVGECKTNARGLNEAELQKLWAAANRVNAPATFTATLDRSAKCSELWRVTTDANGRPHFALTAEHLYDLPVYGPAYGEELFGWRDDLIRLPPDAGMTQEEAVKKAFGEYLLRKRDDPTKYARAPWDVNDD